MRNDKSKSMISIDIILFCYKQEQYIEQALRSIYAQDLPKDVTARIIVADDCSPDGTLSIIKRLAPESPFPMEFLPEEPNMGISKNYKRSFAATKAEYVAILEGDDYWMPNHLKQHIEFLHNHPECSMSMNEITTLIEESGKMQVSVMVRKENESYILVDTHKQIAGGNHLGNLSACVFRGDYLRELPETLYDMPIADWMLGVMLSQRGDIGIIKGSTNVYRIKASGVWAGRSKWKQHKIMLQYAHMYDKFQKGEYHREWSQFEQDLRQDARRNWMHYLPSWLQLLWGKIKNNEERNG